MEDKSINLGVIEIKFLEGFTRQDELRSIQESGWRLPTESEIEYISNLYIDYGVVGKDGWYWTDTRALYELDTQTNFRPHSDSEFGGVILIRED
jgi:hypothetical protein